MSNQNAACLPRQSSSSRIEEEFLKPLGISQYRLAKDISVPARRINEIVLGKRAISPDTGLRLSRYFDLSDRFWINLQARYDIELEKDKRRPMIEAADRGGTPDRLEEFEKLFEVEYLYHLLRRDPARIVIRRHGSQVRQAILERAFQMECGGLQ